MCVHYLSMLLTYTRQLSHYDYVYNIIIIMELGLTLHVVVGQ